MYLNWDSHMLYAFRAYVTPIIVFVGITGNILLITAFYKLQRRVKCRFNLYVMWIAVAHIFDLFFNGLLDDFIGKGLYYASNKSIRVKLDEISSFSCKALTMLTDMGNFVASTLFTIFTADRLLTIYYPIRARGDLYVKNSCWIIAINYIVSTIIFSHVLVVYDLNENYDAWDCSFANKSSIGAQTNVLLVAIGSYSFPTVIILILNCFIAIKFRKVMIKQKTLCINQTAKASNEMRRVVGHLSTSTVFLLFSFPLVTCNLLRLHADHNGWRSLYPESNRMVINFSKFFSSLKSLHYALEFWIYLIFMPNVRKALMNIICIRSICIIVGPTKLKKTLTEDKRQRFYPNKQTINSVITSDESDPRCFNNNITSKNPNTTSITQTQVITSTRGIGIKRLSDII